MKFTGTATRTMVAILPLLFSLALAARTQKHTADSLTQMLGHGLSMMVGQKFENEKSSPAWFKEYALNDTSNDDVTLQTSQEILSRSGFNYENHFSTSDDGYITNLVRIINPLADRSQLKWPPVMLLQGGITDDAIWLFASSIQHHPEKWPRSYQEDGPITSWNRSLAMTLANNGYDVWLVGTRGSTKLNRGHVKYRAQLKSWMDEGHQIGRGKSSSSSSSSDNEIGSWNPMNDLAERLNYWDYSMDELAKHELPRQFDKILQITGAPNVTFVPMSLSSMFGLVFVAQEPAYRERIHNSLVITPIINNLDTNLVINFVQRTLCKWVPIEIGTIILDEFLFKDWVRKVMIQVLKPMQIRYTLGKAMVALITGPSARYQTLLEPAVIGHLYKQTSFKEGKHWCQQVTAGRLQKYDYGAKKNHKVYGTLRPPTYDLSEADFGDWLLVSAGNDKLATMPSVRQYVESVRRPPSVRVHIEHYNHIDVWAALDNDLRVNLPILKFLDERHYPISVPSSGRLVARSLHELSSSSSSSSSNEQNNIVTTPQLEQTIAGHVKRNVFTSNEPLSSSSLSEQSLHHD